MNKKTRVMLVLLAGMTAFHACKKDKDTEEDKALYDELATATFQYQGGTVLQGAGNSPHGPFRLRFNATANAALDSTGELPAGGTFPTGSLLVKEAISNGATTLYAVMKKDPGSVYAANGWLWAEYNPDGSTQISVNKKGVDGCVSCHAGNTNRDYTNTFDFH